MANTQEDNTSQHPDLLAAVVLHTLVSEAHGGMTTAALATACERNPDAPGDMAEVEAALAILLDDGLAERATASGAERGASAEGDARGEPDTTLESGSASKGLYRPTRAAVRAAELSF